MAKEVTRFEAIDGSLHTTHEEAVIADVATLIGKVGTNGDSLLPGIVRAVVANREAIIAALKELPARSLTDQPLKVAA